MVHVTLCSAYDISIVVPYDTLNFVGDLFNFRYLAAATFFFITTLTTLILIYVANYLCVFSKKEVKEKISIVCYSRYMFTQILNMKKILKVKIVFMEFFKENPGITCLYLL